MRLVCVLLDQCGLADGGQGAAAALMVEDRVVKDDLEEFHALDVERKGHRFGLLVEAGDGEEHGSVSQ